MLPHGPPPVEKFYTMEERRLLAQKEAGGRACEPAPHQEAPGSTLPIGRWDISLLFSGARSRRGDAASFCRRVDKGRAAPGRFTLPE